MRCARTFVMCVGIVILLAYAQGVPAAIVTFSGGTVTMWNSSTQTTSDFGLWQGVDNYVESGFKLAFIDPARTDTFTSSIGDYYNAHNAVIHGHWATGPFGTLTGIEITKVGGGSFDLNYFILTSNTDSAGGGGTGNEQAYINAWQGGSLTYSQLLPPEIWGFPATQIFLGQQFDAVDKVSFTVANTVHCFGMDEFYIDQAAPGGGGGGGGGIPEPASLAIWGALLVGLGGVSYFRRRRMNPC